MEVYELQSTHIGIWGISILSMYSGNLLKERGRHIPLKCNNVGS